jgi:putative resolvase
MRLSAYAKQMGISYKTAFRWWRAGKLDAYQLDTGTIIVREPGQPQEAMSVALYARVSSTDQKEDLERQMQRLKDYAASRGYHVTKTVSELASGLNESRPKFLKLLTDASIGVIVVEHRDRATRFGLAYIECLMQMQGRRLEVIFPSDTDNDLVDDFIAVITGMASRIHGRRTSKRRAQKIKDCVESAMKEEE